MFLILNLGKQNVPNTLSEKETILQKRSNFYNQNFEVITIPSSRNSLLCYYNEIFWMINYFENVDSSERKEDFESEVNCRRSKKTRP